MIAGSRLGGSAYIWTDKRGGNHIVDLGTRVPNSELSFLDDNNTRVYYSIPTIQNVSVTQDVTLPTHPTLDNSYIQQFAKENPARVNFDIILAEELFTNFDVLSDDGSIEQRDLTTDEFIEIQENEDVSVEDILDETGMYSVKDLIAIFEDIKNSRRVFMLTTNLQMNDLLDNLVIKSISYVADKESRSVVACSIEAERVHFAQITYETLDAEEVNGLMVNSGEGSEATNDIYANYTLGDDGDQAFNDDFFTKVGNFVLNKEADLHVKFGQAIKDYCGKNNMAFPVHYIMTEEIDRNRINDANLIYSFRFPSDIGINTTGGMQTQQGFAAYEFYTNEIKLSFGGKSEIKIEAIYREVNTTIGMDSLDTVDAHIESIPLLGTVYSSARATGKVVNSVSNLFSDELGAPEFKNGAIDRETGLYDLVESYGFLGIDYNTEKRLKYKDCNSKIDAAGRDYRSAKENIGILTSGQLTVKRLPSDTTGYGMIQGYKCHKRFPALELSYRTSSDTYGNKIPVYQSAEIDWKFGSFEIPWYISAGSQSIADNRNSIISYWKSDKMLNTTQQTITVHYGVLFVGAKLIVIFFNSNVMNDRTVLAMNKTVE